MEKVDCHAVQAPLAMTEKGQDSKNARNLQRNKAVGFLMRKQGCADFCAEIRLERLSHKQKASSLLYRKKPTPKTRKEV